MSNLNATGSPADRRDPAYLDYVADSNLQNYVKQKFGKQYQNLSSKEIDELVRERLYRIKSAKSTDAESSAVSGVTSDDTEPWCADMDQNKYVRTSNGFMRTDTGRKVDDDRLTHQNCYTTLVNDKGCDEHVYQCLLNDDAESLDKCLQSARNVDFNKVSKDQVSNMHPLVALRTLQKFGFKTRSIYDPLSGSNLEKVQSVDDWLNSLSDSKRTDIIRSNSQLIKYLSLIVDLVNSNPGILNPSYSGKTQESVGQAKGNNYLDTLGLKIKPDPTGPPAKAHELKVFRQNLKSSSLYGVSAFSGHNSPFKFMAGGELSTPFGSSVTPDVSIVTPQSGGMVIQRFPSSKASKAVGSSYIKEIFHSALQDLAAKGKKLNSQDEQRLRKHLESLETLENSVARSVAYIEEYNNLLRVFKDKSAETLSMDKLKRFVSRYANQQKSYLSQEDYLLKILQTLDEISAKDSNSNDGDLNPINVEFNI